MIYTEFKPHSSLASYIDAYWTAKGGAKKLMPEKILPDGCIDVILNLGNDCITDDGNFVMHNERPYLIGTMTKWKETTMDMDTHLLGIRFKPGGFSAFYRPENLNEAVDKTLEADKALALLAINILQNGTEQLDHFFARNLKKHNHFLLQVVQTIQQQKGAMKVADLAKIHFTTVRQLERMFHLHMGITPKAFINLVRFQHASHVIRQRKPNESLLHIAFSCGYNDHAHMVNEFKYYAGVAPSFL